MNERIKELAERAHEWSKCASWSTNPEYGDKKFEDLYNEKFADLIVRECVRVCDAIADTAWSKDEVKYTEQCIDTIKQHFGLEE